MTVSSKVNFQQATDKWFLFLSLCYVVPQANMRS